MFAADRINTVNPALMNKAVFIDKDGTLIPDIPYNVQPGLITLENGVVEGLKLLARHGYMLVIISNQAGVARGYFSEAALQPVKEKISGLLRQEGITLHGFYYCPHHPEGKVELYTLNCSCRKPAPGLILRAAADLQINLQASWMVGDILHDVEAGNRAGCRTVLINNGNETEWTGGAYRTPHIIAAGVAEAAALICMGSPAKQEPYEKQLV